MLRQRVKWHPRPGWTSASDETLVKLAALFPTHVGHEMRATALVSMTLRFWCYECEEHLEAPLNNVTACLDFGTLERNTWGINA